MKILFCLKKAGYFPYHASTIRSLQASGHEIVVLCPEGDLVGHTSERPLTVGPLLSREAGWKRNFVVNTRELRSYGSYLRRSDQSRFYRDRWKSYLSRKLRVLISIPGVNWLLRSPLADKVFARIEDRIPADRRVLEYVRDTKPDVVVASPANMRHSRELEYVKAAKVLGIPTVVNVISWDNLSTKGLFHVAPDALVVWNESQARQARQIHGLSDSRIKVGGAAFFDKWTSHKGWKLDREGFCMKVGLDPQRPFVAYLGSAASIAKDESWLIDGLKRAFSTHALPEMRAMQILVRPHPANFGHYTWVEEELEGVRIWPRQGGLSGSDESAQEFFQTLKLSVAAVGLNTSGMLDAVILDVPCVSILEERYKKTQEEALHFQDLVKAETVGMTRSFEQCTSSIAQIVLNGSDGRELKRAAFTSNFVRPNGLQREAGFYCARAIEQTAGCTARFQQPVATAEASAQGAV